MQVVCDTRFCMSKHVSRKHGVNLVNHYNGICCRAEELEVALMEMVKEDNRLILSAQVLFPLTLFVPFTIHLV
jgi:hypothetical protein